MRALKIITGHVIYNLAYTYKFQLKTTMMLFPESRIFFTKLLQKRNCRYRAIAREFSRQIAQSVILSF